MPATKTPADKLSEREKAFVREYLVDLSQAGAARRAGFSERTAKEQGYQLLQRPHVKAAIQAEMDKRAEKAGLTAQKVLSDIERIATKAEAAKDWGAALKGRELLGKHLKLFTDKVEHSGRIGLGPVDLSDDELARIAAGRSV